MSLLMALIAAPPALGHALLGQSGPPDGAALDAPPDRIVITFAEEPEPALSLIRVVDSAGRQVGGKPAGAVPGQPLRLQLQIPTLPRGIYTVTWRTVSRVDGHVTGGAFAFGVGIAPAGPTTPPAAPPPSILDVVARWVFYVRRAMPARAAEGGGGQRSSSNGLTWLPRRSGSVVWRRCCLAFAVAP